MSSDEHDPPAPSLIDRRVQFAERLDTVRNGRSFGQIELNADISSSTANNLVDRERAKRGVMPTKEKVKQFLIGCRLTEEERKPLLAEYDDLYPSAPTVPAPRRETAKLTALRRVSDEAVEEIAFVLPQVPGRTAGVRLDDHLYVARQVEAGLVRDIQAQLDTATRGSGARPRATAVLGEPGHGKSCLLWWLHRRFSADADVFLVPAAALHSLQTAGLFDGLQEAASTRPVVLLLDTADALLHHRQDVPGFVHLLERLSELGIPTVLASRVVEAAVLEQEYRGNLSALLSKHVLGPYTEQEWPAAVDAYAAIYYRPPGTPGPRHGGVAPVDHLAVDAETVRSDIAAAVARGLPLSEVVIHPLALRVLFEVCAPNSPTTEVDVADLHDRLWKNRVVENRRAYADGPDAAPAAATQNLSQVAEELGLAMIRIGTFWIDHDDCVKLITRRLNESAEHIEADLVELRRRDVIRMRATAEGTVVSFWHQTMAEHAAGRALAAYGPAGLELLAQRITAYPDDLLLAEVAGHAFRRRTDPAVLGLDEGTSHLAALLRHDDAFVRVTGLRLYAQQRAAGAAVAGDAHFALERADTWEILQFLDVLGAVRRTVDDTWPTDLAVVWNRTVITERPRLLATLARLAHQQPGAVHRFLRRHRVLLDDDTPLDPTGLPSGTELSLVLRRLQHADPAAGQHRIEALWRAARANRDGGLLRHLLDALHDLLAAGHHELDAYIAEVPGLIGALGQRDWTGGVEQIIEAASGAWSASSAARLPPAPQDRTQIWASWVRVLDGGTLTPADRVRLRGHALQLRGHPDDDVRVALDTLLATHLPASWDHLARYVLVPLLGPGDAPGVQAARRYCATHLTATTEPLIQALTQRTRHRLPCDVIAACVPALASAAWLEAPWPIVITARAATGGHPAARAALDHWLHDPGDLRDRVGADRAAQLRTEVAKDVGTATDMLDWLLRDARRDGDFSSIADLSQRGGPVFRHHADALGAFAAELIEDVSVDCRAVGYQLLTALVMQRHGPAFVTPSWLVGQIATEQNHRVFRKLAALAEATLLRTRQPSPPEQLDPAVAALRARIDDGDRFLAQRRWSATGDREHVLAGADAHRLLIVLHAMFAPIGPVSWPQTSAELHRLAFEPITAHRPPNDAPPAEWANRLASLPQLACRLTDAGRVADALDLMDRAIGVIFNSDPNPRAKWKNGHANTWRPFLRKLVLSERDDLPARIHTLAARDEYLAQHLIEVGGQELVDISEQLKQLRLSELSPSLSSYVRRTAVWAGRKGIGETWPDLYTLLHAIHNTGALDESP
ncbi:hypothetical protein [Dactylosporangium sp. CA-092794]|uniref:hypothetical protein n=1 Tax=Dactylosporangium sp. CA-092794 TaxID=3239929 RepID=UPI003D8F21B5